MQRRKFIRTTKEKTIAKKLVERWPEKKIAEQRYKEFVEPALTHLRIHARILTRDPGLAGDLVQEATIKIIANAGKWRADKGRTKKNFAELIGTRQMISSLRSEKAKHDIIHSEEVVERFFSTLSRRQAKSFEKLASASREAIAAETKQLLKEAMVSQKHKDTFTYYAGLEDGQIKTYKQTAEKFKIPIGTVKSRIIRVREEIKKVILRKLKTLLETLKTE